MTGHNPVIPLGFGFRLFYGAILEQDSLFKKSPKEFLLWDLT